MWCLRSLVATASVRGLRGDVHAKDATDEVMHAQALGASIQLERVLDFSDAMVFVLYVPDILADTGREGGVEAASGAGA